MLCRPGLGILRGDAMGWHGTERESASPAAARGQRLLYPPFIWQIRRCIPPSTQCPYWLSVGKGQSKGTIRTYRPGDCPRGAAASDFLLNFSARWCRSFPALTNNMGGHCSKFCAHTPRVTEFLRFAVHGLMGQKIARLGHTPTLRICPRMFLLPSDTVLRTHPDKTSFVALVKGTSFLPAPFLCRSRQA